MRLREPKKKSKIDFAFMLFVGTFIIFTMVVLVMVLFKMNTLINIADEILKIGALEKENAVIEELIENGSNLATNSTESLLSASDRDLIERVVAAEARGEEYRGKVAVAQTIKDRGDLWGMSYKEVVLAPNQYAPPYQGVISDEVKQAVTEVFDLGGRAFEEPVTHFFSGSSVPSWTETKVSRGEIGRHRFYY